MNCPGISVGALKELAENRIVEATARGYGTDHQYDDFEDITTLSIAGCGFDLYSFVEYALTHLRYREVCHCEKYSHDIGTATRCPAL